MGYLQIEGAQPAAGGEDASEMSARACCFSHFSVADSQLADAAPCVRVMQRRGASVVAGGDCHAAVRTARSGSLRAWTVKAMSTLSELTPWPPRGAVSELAAQVRLLASTRQRSRG